MSQLSASCQSVSLPLVFLTSITRRSDLFNFCYSSVIFQDKNKWIELSFFSHTSSYLAFSCVFRIHQCINIAQLFSERDFE